MAAKHVSPTGVTGQAVAYHSAGGPAVQRLTRADRKALQTVIHMARTDRRITDDKCTELCAMVDRVTEDQLSVQPVARVAECSGLADLSAYVRILEKRIARGEDGQRIRDAQWAKAT